MMLMMMTMVMSSQNACGCVVEAGGSEDARVSQKSGKTEKSSKSRESPGLASVRGSQDTMSEKHSKASTNRSAKSGQ